MMDPVSIRIADLLAMLAEPARTALLALVGDDVGALTDGERIRARAATLSQEDRDAVSHLLSFEPDVLELLSGSERRVPAAEKLGLMFVGDLDGLGDRIWVPLEVRVALLDDFSAHTTPVAALLGTWEPEELHSLAQLHGVVLEDEGDDVFAAAIEIASVLLDVERLDGVFDSLPMASKRLAHWLAEVDEPVPAEKAAAKARRFAELAGDPTATSEAVLTRLGIAHEIDVDGDALLVIPPDLRESLRPIIDTALSERCRQLFETLRDDYYPAFRDLFPHGAGGNALVAARQRVLRAQSHGPDPRDLLDRVLTVFRVLDPLTGVGELVSLHLDVATPDRFAQECLRSWLGSLDDDFTRVLVEPFGGDCVALADWILDEERPEQHDEELDAEDWASFLFDLRAQILFVLSVLSPGQWFNVGTLVSLVAAIYRRLMWHARGFNGLSDNVPEHAFPMAGVDVTQEEEAKLYESLVILLAELLEPIGAVMLDRTGQLFMVNTEALRLFRDGDPGFDVLWDDVATFVGDDVELWAPIPTSWGAQVSGVSPMFWLDEHTVELQRTAHMHDLMRLNEWAQLQCEGGSFRFRFDERSGVESDDPSRSADMLAWLVARCGGEVPEPVRMLLGGDAEPDESDWPVQVAQAVRRQLDELETWGETPPLELMESIRSGGPSAVPVLVDAMAALVEANEWEQPMLRHLCILTGEFGANEAVPLLLRILGAGRFEPTEGAASAALARIGESAIEGLGGLLSNITMDIDKRVTIAGTLAAIAALHPHAAPRASTLVKSLASSPEDVPEDVPTLVGIFAAETGDPTAEMFLHTLKDQGLWMDEVMAFDEALWIAGLSPSVWGHPVFAAPLAQLYPPLSEAEALRENPPAPPLGKKRKP